MTQEVPVEYMLMIRDLAQEDRPRERLKRVGPAALTTAELLAVILRVGTRGVSALRLAERLLVECDGLSGLSRATITELAGISEDGVDI